MMAGLQRPGSTRWSAIGSFVLFAVVGACGTGCQFVVLIALTRLAGVDAVIASTIGAIVGACVNFVLNHRFTFDDAPPAREAAPRYVVLTVTSLLSNTALFALFFHVFKWNDLVAQILVTSIVFFMNFALSALWVFRNQRTRED